MSPDIARIEAGIRALEAQHEALGDDGVDLALAPLRQRLATLKPVGSETGGVSLRQVTLLFADADAVDFTRLAQGLDPEDVGAVMDDVLARGTAVVAAQGGRVLQYVGDSLLAVFGTRRFQRWARSATRTRCASRQRRSGGTRWSC